MKKLLSSLLLLITILSPVLFITTGMRIALSPIFFNIEYRLPNFPDDSFGFSLEDRLNWADFSIAFISGKISEQEFTDATFDDGSPLFNSREISHMIDVRNLTVIMLWIWRFLIVFFITVLFYSVRNAGSKHYLFAIKRGARITILLIVSILIFLLINFNQLFTLFHQIFFEGDSWLFYFSDTLIRLFPLKFWQDLFIFIGGISLLISLIIILSDQKRSAKKIR